LLFFSSFLSAAGTPPTPAGDALRARVAPVPAQLDGASWSPTVRVTRAGRPAAARLVLTIRQGAAKRVFAARMLRRGVYQVRVAFPADGRWRWALRSGRRALAAGAINVTRPVTFDLPYDLAAAPDGTVFFLDRSRVLRLDPTTRRVSVHARTQSGELVAMERLGDGTIFATDFPADRILRIGADGRVTPVVSVPAPADLVADADGTTLWVASIAPGIGVVRVDVASGRVEPFAQVDNPHGIDRGPAGELYVHDGHLVSRVDGLTGAVIRFAAADAVKLELGPDGALYGASGDPSGGRVLRIGLDGRVATVAGTGSLGRQRDGFALEAPMLPSSVTFAPDGTLLVAQTEPVAAIRRVDLSAGEITTLAIGR
jgi:serine/threonine protein kinase, bacterial